MTPQEWLDGELRGIDREIKEVKDDISDLNTGLKVVRAELTLIKWFTGTIAVAILAAVVRYLFFS